MKTTKLLLLSALIVIICFAGRSIRPFKNSHGRSSNGIDTLSDELQKVAMLAKEAFIRGDSSLYLKSFTPDACVLAPNMPTLCGQQGLTRFYKGTRQAGIRDVVFTSLGLYGQTAEYVTEQGSFEVFDGDAHSRGKGKVINIWKKTAQGWRLFRQMLNFDAAMPPPPAK